MGSTYATACRIFRHGYQIFRYGTVHRKLIGAGPNLGPNTGATIPVNRSLMLSRYAFAEVPRREHYQQMAEYVLAYAHPTFSQNLGIIYEVQRLRMLHSDDAAAVRSMRFAVPRSQSDSEWNTKLWH